MLNVVVRIVTTGL